MSDASERLGARSEPKASAARRQRGAMLARTGLALALVAWLLWRADPHQILGTLAGVDPWRLAAALATLFSYSVLKAWNWQQLVIGLGLGRPRQFRQLLVCYFSGGLLGTVLPSTAGTDAIRAFLAQRRFGGELTAYAASVVVLNAISWMAACTLGLFAVVALSVLGTPLRVALLAAPIFCGVVVAVVSVHLLLKYRRRFWLGLLRLTPRPLLRVRRPLRRFADQLLLFERAEARFGAVFATALGTQLGVAVTLSLAGRAVGIELPFWYWMIYGPLASTVGLIPATFLGFGIDQVTAVYFLDLLGVPQARAFSASALVSLLNLLINIGVGGLVFATASDERRPAVVAVERTAEDRLI